MPIKSEIRFQGPVFFSVILKFGSPSNMLALYKGWDIEQEPLLGLFSGLLKNFVTKKHLFFGIFWHKIDYNCQTNGFRAYKPRIF